MSLYCMGFYIYPAPNIAPKNVAVVRVNGTHMNSPLKKPAALSLAILLLMISPMDVQGEKLGLNLLEKMSLSYKLIGSLDSAKGYYVTVSARTSAGEGVASDAFGVNGKEKQ